MQSCHIELNTI